MISSSILQQAIRKWYFFGAALLLGFPCGCAHGNDAEIDLRSDLQKLSSDEYQGRLSGTPGAEAAAAFLDQSLARLGAERVERKKVEISRTLLRDIPRLSMGDHPFEYRRDFVEWPAFSGGGFVLGRPVIMTQAGAMPKGGKGEILIVPSAVGIEPSQVFAEAVRKAGFKAVLIESPQHPMGRKTIAGGQGPLPVLAISSETRALLAQHPDEQVRLELPLEHTRTWSDNVVRRLSRSSAPGAPTFLLSAHYDHVGDDPGGRRYPGAFDNASGVAVVLEAARRYAALRHPGFNLLIAFTTGEESGLSGATSLATDPPAPFDFVVTVDGIGSQPRLDMLRMGQAHPLSLFASFSEGVMASKGIKAMWVEGNDDSYPFIAMGYPTIGLGQEPVLPGVMHTPEDKPGLVHTRPMRETAELILDLFAKASEFPFASGVLQVRRAIAPSATQTSSAAKGGCGPSGGGGCCGSQGSGGGCGSHPSGQGCCSAPASAPAPGGTGGGRIPSAHCCS